MLGGTGFVGVAACKELMRRGVETIAASRRAHPYGTFTSHRHLDARDGAALASVLDGARPDVVLDLTGADRTAAEALVRVFVGRCVFASCSPDLPGVVLHSGAVIGAGDPSLRIAEYVRRVEEGEPMVLPAETAHAEAGLVWNRDLGYACALACDSDRSLEGAYGIGFGGLSLEGLVRGIGRALGFEVQIVERPAAEMPEGASLYQVPGAVDLTRARAELGFEPSALEDALAEILAWYRVARPRFSATGGG